MKILALMRKVYNFANITLSVECHLYASANLAIVGSDNGLSPVWHQAIIQLNASLLLIGPLKRNFNDIQIKLQQLPYKK